jgi:hypothetical protein
MLRVVSGHDINGRNQSLTAISNTFLQSLGYYQFSLIPHSVDPDFHLHDGKSADIYPGA